MKGNEITKKDITQWGEDGWFPVCCRICGEVMLYPKTYNKDDFIGYECSICRAVKKMGNIAFIEILKGVQK